MAQNYKKSSGVKAPVGVWNLTNSMLAVTIILLLIILFAILPVGAYKLPQQTIGGGGGGSSGSGSEIIANSCNADSVCEISGRLQSSGNMWLTSESGFTKIEGDLTLTKLGQAGGTQFKTDDLGTLTIETSSRKLNTNSDISLFKNNSRIGMFFVEYPNTLWIESIDNIPTQPNIIKLVGDVQLIDLAGNETAYLCINPTGKIFKSLQPCR